MASTGTALYPGASTFPGTSVFPGQGTLPIARVQISFDDVSISTPIWTNYESRLRSFTVSRGRGSELSEFDAGTATVTLDNRDRAFDPNVNASVRPLNRLRLYAEHAGSVYEMFRGYAESYSFAWDPSGIVDATATMNAVDELKVLAEAALPVTNPPRESYQALAMADNPDGYWEMNEDPVARSRQPGDPGIFGVPYLPAIQLWRYTDLRRAPRFIRRKR